MRTERPSKTFGMIDDLIDPSGTYCLNASPSKPWQNLQMGDESLRLESDADEQLLLHVAFRQCVKLSKIIFGCPTDESCPAEISIFVNLNSPGFNDVDGKCAYQTDVNEDEGTKVLALPAVKFNRVESVTIFISSNHGADISSLHKLNFEGTPVMNTDVSKIHDRPK